jgi:integrase
MSVYFVEKKGWRYDFMLKGERYTKTWFKTKREAKEAEQKKRTELNKPTSIDMDFLELLNLRLDEVKQRLSHEHYMDTFYHAKRWAKRWSSLNCAEISIELITELRDERSNISNQTANKELRHLRSLFNWGTRKGYIHYNPASVVDMLRVEKRNVYVPSQQDIEKVFAVANGEQLDYLWCLRDSLARSREINQLEWEHIDFQKNTITLYTRKKKHGTKTPRIIPMTKKLCEVLAHRNDRRTKEIPWVFWHKYYSRQERKVIIGPFKDRKKFMRTLCEKAGVRYFRFHPLRHAGASLMENINIPLTHIQEILGHENRTTTETYIHALNKSTYEVMCKFEAARQSDILRR